MVLHKMHIIIRLLYLIIYIAFYVTSDEKNCNTMPRKIVIDTDAGADDAEAIMLALQYEAKSSANNIKVIAITCSYGNAYLKDVEQNVLKTLTMANRNDIPVYGGAEHALIKSFKFDDYFGKDGFGDFNFTYNITTKMNRTQNASVALVDLVKKYPGEITLVSLGPLTNTAIAILLEPRFLYLLKEHVIMGSNANFQSTSDEAENSKIEFNFKQDPESNWITLNNTNKPSTILPIQTVINGFISKEEYRYIYNQLNETIANFLYKANRKALEKIEYWEPADAIAMTVAIQPEIITQSFKTNLNAVISGDASGSVVIDHDNNIHNAKVVQNFNVTEFKKFMIRYLS